MKNSIRKIGFVAAFAGATAFTVIGIGSSMSACTPAATPANVVDAGGNVANNVCTQLSAFDESGVLQTICAYLPTILEVAAVVLPLLAKPAPGAKPEACKSVAPGTPCWTNTERLAIIRGLRRADAGVTPPTAAHHKGHK